MNQIHHCLRGGRGAQEHSPNASEMGIPMGAACTDDPTARKLQSFHHHLLHIVRGGQWNFQMWVRKTLSI